jgi:pyruvate,water dikinase
MLDAMFDREHYMQEIEHWERTQRPEIRARVDALWVRDPSALSNPQLLDAIRASLELTARGLEIHARLATPGLLAVGALYLFVSDVLGWRGERVLDLLTGSSTSTTAEHRAIAALADAHADELAACGPFPARWSALFDRCPRFAADLARWLDHNRLRMLHYDPKHAMFGERPELVLSVARAVANPGERRAPEPDASTVLNEARAQVPVAHRATFERLLTHARRGYALRDENGIDTVSRPAGLLRWFVLELGARVTPALEAPDHAVYLYASEHAAALRGALTDLSARIARRRGEESFALRHRPPKWLGPQPARVNAADAFPSGLRRMMRVFDWMMELESTPPDSSEHTLRGVGIGSRVVTARARVIDDPSALGTLLHGEVLVCRITSPEWSLAIGRAAAIVTDEGALLSHPAIIAREYAIPAVLATGRATARIATGDTVRVDPVEATVSVLR